MIIPLKTEPENTEAMRDEIYDILTCMRNIQQENNYKNRELFEPIKNLDFERLNVSVYYDSNNQLVLDVI